MGHQNDLFAVSSVFLCVNVEILSVMTPGKEKMEKPFSSRCSKEWNHLLSHVSLEMYFNMTKISGVQHGHWCVRMNL